MKVFLVSLCFFLQFFNSYAQLQLNSYPSAIQIIPNGNTGSSNYTNIDNALVIDGQFAIGTGGSFNYDTIVWYGFNITDLPSSSNIASVDIIIEAECDSNNGCKTSFTSLYLSGTPIGSYSSSSLTSTCWPTTDTEITYSASTLRESTPLSLTPADLENNIKAALQPQGICATRGTPYIDGMYLVVYYTLPTTTVQQQTTQQQTTQQQTTQQQSTQQFTTQGSKQQSTTQVSNLQTTSQFSQQTTQRSNLQTTQVSNQQTTQGSNQQITNTQAFTTPHSNNTIAIALGVVFGLIGLLCIICIIILIIFYRKRKSNSETIDLHPIPENKNSNISSSSPNPSSGYKDVPLSQFLAHISNLLEEDPITQKKKYELEYSNIDNEMNLASAHFNYTTARSEFNKSKNRYENVLAAEHSRVKLSGGPESDYINANYISGLIPNSTKAYIATQGPLDNTVGDFWRMIWETESRVIVMLTKEIENDRVKCAKYWTDGQSLTIGNLMINYHSQPEQTSALIIRKFKLTNTENGEERVITQFQYIGWPDHGLPISTEEFLDLAKRTDKANLSRAPLIVHCSAGLGRSGTFIVIHMILAMIKYERRSYPDQESLINIPEVLINLRKNRKGMIQTEEQYLFCFLCISDGIAEITSKKKESDYVEFTFIRQKLLQEAPQTDNDKAD